MNTDKNIKNLVIDDLNFKCMAKIAEDAHNLFLRQYETDKDVYIADMTNYLLRLELGLKVMALEEKDVCNQG